MKSKAKTVKAKSRFTKRQARLIYDIVLQYIEAYEEQPPVKEDVEALNAFVRHHNLLAVDSVHLLPTEGLPE